MLLTVLRWLPRQSPLFPYTTLFRSRLGSGHRDRRRVRRARRPSPILERVATARAIRDQLVRRQRHRIATIEPVTDRKSTHMNSSHPPSSYADFRLTQHVIVSSHRLG